MTGVTVFIGGRLARHLKAMGVDVRGLVRSAAQVEQLRRQGFDCYLGDVTDPISLSRACAGCDIVINCAAMTNRSRGSAACAWRTNGDGPAILWQAARHANVQRLVHCSTSGIHGMLRHTPADETSPARPDSLYRRSKWRGEVNLHQHITSNIDASLETVIARPTTVAGPGSERTWRRLVESVRAGQVTQFGNGHNNCHVSDVDDICQGLIRCAIHPHAAGGTFIIGSAAATPVREIFRLFGEAIGVSFQPRRSLPAWPARLLGDFAMRGLSRLGWEPHVLHSLSFLVGERSFSIERARKTLAFAPQFDAKATIERTVVGMKLDADNPSPSVRDI
ncbi:MAG: NAD-dependent epimerase/dehydratase family protein [Planctomycetota bacterium]|nr:NAD-dependent epimerase/dehydratase family protein [Planctomycetota bacterium]